MADGNRGTERKGRPYTERQIEKGRCFRCGGQAKFQWNACADDNIWRMLCAECDVLVNEAVCRILHPETWRAKIKRYCRKIGHIRGGKS